jgi:hypothetical protein
LFLFSAAPYDIAINPVQVDVIVGSAFSAKCTAKGDPAPTFSWYFGDRMIQTGPDLSITASTSTDAGLYPLKISADGTFLLPYRKKIAIVLKNFFFQIYRQI